jgi:hypothetical protein
MDSSYNTNTLSTLPAAEPPGNPSYPFPLFVLFIQVLIRLLVRQGTQLTAAALETLQQPIAHGGPSEMMQRHLEQEIWEEPWSGVRVKVELRK